VLVMKAHRKFFFGLLPLVFLTLSSVFAGEAVPSLATIIQQVIARDDANQKTLQSMEYHQTLKTERLDETGHVMKQQELNMLVRPGASPEIQVLSEKGDDLPSDPDQAALKAQGKAAQTKKINFSLKDMANRFNISLAGTDTFEGQPVYVVAFEPKPNQPYRDQTEKVLNDLQGKMWVSTKDYSVLKTEANLAEPVEVAWIFASITTLNFHYELNNISGGMGPAWIQTSVQLDAPFISIRQRMTVTMTQFVPREKSLLSGK
jgi:outer membrane lipoprotein-sorting protein